MVTPPLRIVYFGTPEFAVPSLARLLSSSHSVVAVVSQPDKPKGRGHRLVPTPVKEAALAASVTVRQPDRLRDEEFLREIASLEPDLGVVAAYGKLLPEPLLQIPRLGMINVHGSILPRWRGAAPVHRAVIAGDSETGITIMRVVKTLDAGAMLATRRRAIGPDETSVEVERGLAVLGAALLLETIDALADGNAVETPQPDEGVTYASKLAKPEGGISWALPAEQIHNLVRGLQPWPLVTARLAGVRVLVHGTRVTPELTDAPAGTIVHASGDTLAVAAGDRHVIRIVRIQPEGRRVMDARDFLAGRQIETGEPMLPA